MANEKRKMGPAAILKSYFGFLPGQVLAGFAAEIQALNEDEKTYLVYEAAKELGVEVKTA